ncbi:CHAT domain-containing protein [Streptomyces sp. NPDC091385]|uniref:CHAT domain-containing protein n=1 Tax=Streptomyces sp. NPDC091385 TaxID=3365997 RepID=UPI00382036C0
MPDDPVKGSHWRLEIRRTAVTLSAGTKTVAQGPGAQVSYPLAETVRALNRAYETAGRGARRRATGVPPAVLTRRLGHLLAEAAGSAVTLALAAAERETAGEHGLPLAIEAEPGELADLPWEALTLPGQTVPLALHPTIRPYRAFAETETETEARAGVDTGTATDTAGPVHTGGADGRPLRLLVLLAGPRTAPGRREALLDLDAETARLATALSRIPGTAELRVLSSGSLTALRTALAEKPADIVHIVCHAGPGELLLEDDNGGPAPVTAHALCEALRDGHGVPAVVLAGCSTASSVRRNRPHAGPEPAHDTRYLPGLAQSLAESGSPAVVAMSAPVRDVYAGALMADMYAELAAGRPLWDALHAARTEQERVRRSTNERWLPEWHVPLLFAGPRPTRATPDPGEVHEEEPAAAAVPPLALPLGAFVGRRTHLRTALKALAEDAALVVHGVGGVGKSAFVGELLRLRALPAPTVLLSGLVSPDSILRETAAALAPGADAEHVRAVLDPQQHWSARLDDLVAAQLTLVLDDFETNLSRDARGRTRFTDPELGEFFAAWVTRLTGASLLIASRHPLPLPNGTAAGRVRQMPLPPLSRDETDLMRLRLPLTRLLPPKYWQRIRHAAGGHPRTYAYLEALLGTGRPADDLAERIGRLGGGLDVARSRVRGQLRPALREALSLTAADTLLQELLATLDPESRTVLHRAAVYRVPVPARAFGVVEDVEDVEDAARARDDRGHGTPAALATLVEAGLLAEDGVDETGTPVWSVHRWIAAELERLDPSAAQDAHCRAAAHHEARFHGDATTDDGTTDDGTTGDRNDPKPDAAPPALSDAARVEAAFEALHHLGAAGRNEQAGVLGRSLCRILHAKGRWSTERALCLRMLEWSEPGTESEAVVHRQLGLIARDRGEMHAARTHLERALAVSTGADDVLGVAYAEHQLGSIEHEQGDHRAAESRYLRARGAFRELGRERDAAATLYQLSMLNQYDGQPERAAAGFAEAMEVFRREGDVGAVIACHRSLSYLAEDEQDLAKAMDHCRAAVALCEESEDLAQAEELRNQIGTLHVLAGELTEAHREFDAALRSAVARDAPEEMARSHQHLGICSERMGAMEIAEEHIRTALRLNTELGRVVGQAQCLTILARLTRLRGRPADGLSLARTALALYARTDEVRDRSGTYRVIGDCLRDLGRTEAARRFYTAGVRDAQSPRDEENNLAALRELDAGA